jgi:cell division protein FtsQ
LERVKRPEPDAFPPEVPAEDEPRYLRRQKPVEVRRKSFARRVREDVWPWARLAILSAALLAVAGMAANFLLYSPALALTDPAQIQVSGNQYVARDAVVALFVPDRNRSLLRVPLETRRAQLERISWVESARVMRALPDTIRVEITERRPVAFLRAASDLALVDEHGAILERPLQGDFRLPVVSGMDESTPRDEREKRLRLFQQFLSEIEAVRPGAGDLLSEVDLSSAEDLRAMMLPPAAPATGNGPGEAGGRAGASGAAGEASGGAVLVHFGASDFGPRFRLLLENFAQWQSQAGRVASIDLRFKKQVVVNRQP